VKSARPPRPTTRARDFAVPLAIALAGGLGALPGTAQRSDPVALLAWLALWAAPAGYLAGAARLPHWALLALPPAAWMGLEAVVDGLSSRDLPAPAWAALAWTGLYAAGFGVNRLAPRGAAAGAGALLLLGALLAALPIAPGHLGSPLPPALAARLLDLSPVTLLAECSGLDWMRHPAVYAPAGAADIDPATRVAFSGALAGPIAFVVGCALATLGEGIGRARAKT
jgi:hypothetical protein